MSKDLVTEFYLPSYGKPRFGRFPEDKYMIGMEFEVGGAYEDWGWIMYEKHYDQEKKVQTYRTFCTARSLEKLIKAAEVRLGEKVQANTTPKRELAPPTQSKEERI